jgi:hypothetical protein
MITPTHFLPCTAIILRPSDPADGFETLQTICVTMEHRVTENLYRHNEWTLYKLQDLRSFANTFRSVIWRS